MLIWKESPLLSMQLLWINLVTDSLPAIALGMEKVEPDIMDRKPKPKNEGIFAHGFGARIVLQGCMFGALTLVAYAVGKYFGGAEGELAIQYGQTMAFIVLAMSQIVQSFNMRSEHSLFKVGFFSNKTLNLAAIAAFVLTAAILFIPGVNTVFGLAFLPIHLYGIAVALFFVPLLVMEVSKAAGFIKHEHDKHK
jgi:Ca2+-transporting ATPase